MHRSLKQYFGVGDCYSGKFLLYLCYLKALDIEKTIESLWKDYILKRTPDILCALNISSYNKHLRCFAIT